MMLYSAATKGNYFGDRVGFWFLLTPTLGKMFVVCSIGDIRMGNEEKLFKYDLERSYLYYSMKYLRIAPVEFSEDAMGLVEEYTERGVAHPRGPKLRIELNPDQARVLAWALKFVAEDYVMKSRNRRADRIYSFINAINMWISGADLKHVLKTVKPPRELIVPVDQELAEEALRVVHLVVKKTTEEIKKMGLVRNAWNCEIKTSFNEKRKHSRGGVYGTQPRINLALRRRLPKEGDDENTVYSFIEYPSLRGNEWTGSVEFSDWRKVLTCLVLHELTHAIQYSIINDDRIKSEFGLTKEKLTPPHGLGFQKIYSLLRKSWGYMSVIKENGE